MVFIILSVKGHYWSVMLPSFLSWTYKCPGTKMYRLSQYHTSMLSVPPCPHTWDLQMSAYASRRRSHDYLPYLPFSGIRVPQKVTCMGYYPPPLHHAWLLHPSPLGPSDSLRKCPGWLTPQHCTGFYSEVNHFPSTSRRESSLLTCKCYELFTMNDIYISMTHQEKIFSYFHFPNRLIYSVTPFLLR